MSKSSLSYALSREIDDFCRGSATDGTEFWVSVVSEPIINEKHQTEVNVRLAQETPEGLEPLGRFTIKAWPSVLDEFDTELMKHPTERPDWILVVYECGQGKRGYWRRMKVHDTRASTLTKPATSGPSKPGAGNGTLGGYSNDAGPVPAAPCLHPLDKARIYNGVAGHEDGFFCEDCGERVG